jgi:hypothetical protein
MRSTLLSPSLLLLGPLVAQPPERNVATLFQLPHDSQKLIHDTHTHTSRSPPRLVSPQDSAPVLTQSPNREDVPVLGVAYHAVLVEHSYDLLR